ncbi:UV-endonuclease UvdE-domain-containing protein [Lasiosphaeria hispida]|uniref:UV-endonuclease UvdE-domain-containing protein n=1 Tax=Lasiosphaeria hispida TaxID=260671 RepID=A0AAJ0HS61_9PEZI|nr:UV-endonuclease UvdE-domain-containing protein [Lasiosphaeria hispida]
MARKSKVSSTPGNDDSATTSDVATPTRPEVKLRRSSRRLTQQSHDMEEDKTREIQGMVMGIKSDEGVPHDEDEEERMETAKEGVELVIEGLARMERRLKKATKRQKLKVEETQFSDARNPRADPSKPSIQPTTMREATLKHSTVQVEEGQVEQGQVEQGQVPTPGESSVAAGKRQKADPDVGEVEASVSEEVPDAPERGAARCPPVNSSYLPLPWKGRIGYACLNTYLRAAKPPVFSSRTCRMSSIIEHRYPLQDPTQPEHPVKNRPDKSKEPNKELGDEFVRELGLANAKDIVKMLRWNDKYGIKFMRLSSEMFPFASHEEHGYKLAPFASEVLAEAGRVAAELGHRLTTHPGQFTQLGSPRKEVVKAAIRDLEYHDELLSLLRLPEQQDRDAVMILHMGGTFGDKAATLDRFRENYAKLLPSVKARLVLENDDVSWSVHDLLPICEELNIPLVLDYHHHNIIFDSSQCREGTYDISQPDISQRIAATWKRKGITQKVHYSEPCAGAVTPRDRRKHSPRVMTLPPCSPDMDLMIEAKDKEQAVFELMRTFKLPGFEKISDVIPYERADESRPAPKVPKKKKNGKTKRKRVPDEDAMDVDDTVEGEEEAPNGFEVSEEDFGMGGPENRVYWPPGMEEWLRPKKREVKKGKAEDEDAVL